MNDQAPITCLFPLDEGTDPSDYEDDFALWIDSQVELLRARKFAQIDLDNIIEELESMGRSEKRELYSRIEILVAHLLKCEFQPDKKSGSWIGTVNEQRSQIAGLLRHSPSLRRFIDEFALSSYGEARWRASTETGMPLSAFPESMPYSISQVLDGTFLP
jgi:hypothetical protein